MKFAFGLLSFLLVATVNATNDSNSPDDPADAVDIPVEVDVECPGVDFFKLSLPTAAFASKTLQETYNKVHQDIDGGDSFLSKIHFDHAFKKKGKRPKVDSDFEDDGDLLGQVATFAAGNGLRGSVDTEDGELVGAFRYWGSWMGNWGCRLCPYLLSNSGGVAVHAWEMAFVEAILESGHKQFDKIKTCTITIAPAPHAVVTHEEDPVELSVKKADDDQEEEDDVVQMSVEIDAGCDGIDYHKLTIEALGFASKALQETYNKVHQDLDGGDSFLSKTHFDHAFKKKGKRPLVAEELGEMDEDELGSWTKYWGSWMGNWGCRLCPDDAAVLGAGGIAVRAWEAEFTATLASSKHKEFSQAKNCNIDIFDKPVVADTATPLASA